MASERKLMLREDWFFLQRQMDRQPPEDRQGIKSKYQEIFLEAYKGDPLEYRAANTGRRAANQWLLSSFGDISSERQWIPIPVTMADVNEAKRRHRESRMRAKWENENRWEGQLGEIVFDRFLAGLAGFEYTWLNRERDQMKEDFRIRGIEIDIKTTGRKWKPKQHWTIGVHQDHAKASRRHFWWVVYQRTPGDMAWVIGGMPSRQFMTVAWFDEEGEQVHRELQVSKGGSMYNINICVPYTWELWLEKFT